MCAFPGFTEEDPPGPPAWSELVQQHALQFGHFGVLVARISRVVLQHHLILCVNVTKSFSCVMENLQSSKVQNVLKNLINMLQLMFSSKDTFVYICMNVFRVIFIFK